MLVSIYCRVHLHRVILYSILCATPFCTGSRINSIMEIYQNAKCWVLSTAMGLVHEPPLLRVMVNPQQTKSGAQCGVCGWWIGLFTHQCDEELLHYVNSHPAIEQYQQLAYVSWQLVDTKSHMKNSFFLQENTNEHTMFPKWLRPTSGSVQSHHTLHKSREPHTEGLCPSTILGCHDLWYRDLSCSLAECQNLENFPE